MGGVAPILISTGLSMVQAKAAKKSTRQAFAPNIVQRTAKLAADERIRKENLKRRKATQTARFAAMGMNPNEGSSAALLTGMQTSADARAADRARLTTMSQTGASAGSGSNLLAKNSRVFQSTLDKLIFPQ